MTSLARLMALLCELALIVLWILKMALRMAFQAGQVASSVALRLADMVLLFTYKEEWIYTRTLLSLLFYISGLVCKSIWKSIWTSLQAVSLILKLLKMSVSCIFYNIPKYEEISENEMDKHIPKDDESKVCRVWIAQ